MKKSMVLIIGCLMLFIGMYFYLKHRPLDVHVDEFVKNLETARTARIEADNARKEWLSHREERQKTEVERLKKLDIPDLSKKAVSILVRHENPGYIVNKAIVTTRKEMGVWIITPPWGNGTDPKDKKYWSMVYRDAKDKDHDWWLEQNNVCGQYRLVGNSNHIYFSIRDESKLQTVLAYVVVFGDTKPFYQVVDGDNCVPEDYCEVLSSSEAKKIFPETMELADGGIYAKHPCNPYALVPVKDFHARLAMDKAVECVVLLGRMGAKSVHVSRMDGEKLDTIGEASTTVMGYGATVNVELVNAMKSEMDFKAVFTGNSSTDIPRTLLENSNWHKFDSNLNGILTARLSDNKLKDWRIIEEGQFDFNFDFKAAASVLNVGEAELKAKIEKMKKTKRTFHVIF